MDTEVILDTVPDKACATFLACPEEAANRVQQRVSSERYQQVLKLHPKCAYKKTYHVLIKRDNKLSPDYLATFKMPTTTWQFTFVLQLAVRPIIQLKIPPHLSAPTELRFEKERLTPEEIAEENCCNLILPRPFHPKFAKHDFKDPTRCLAAAAHFLIRKKLFNSKYPQLHVGSFNVVKLDVESFKFHGLLTFEFSVFLSKNFSNGLWSLLNRICASVK